MPQSLAPEIKRIIDDVKELHSLINQLEQTTRALQTGRNELSNAQKKETELQTNIASTTNLYNQAQKQGKTAIANGNRQQLWYFEAELKKTETLIEKRKNDNQQLERKQQQLHGQKIQQLISTFRSLDVAIIFLTNQNYFDKYVWLDYFKNKLRIKDISPNDLDNLSDKTMAAKIIQTFDVELSGAANALTETDKQDILAADKLFMQIRDDELHLRALSGDIAEYKKKIEVVEKKLAGIQTMKGYSPAKLANFKTIGIIAIVIGIGLVIYSLMFVHTGTLPLPVPGIIVTLAGVLLLWLRYKNDKEARLAQVTKQRDDLNHQYQLDKAESEKLSNKIGLDKNMLQGIWLRRPVLEMINI